MLLDTMAAPSDLRTYSPQQLEQLAAEIRQVLVTTISRTGGHLAPNLGVVELTIALHAEFDSPHDKLLWDVSHQSYVHKLLTGRYDRFQTLRQHEGLAGFTHPGESRHDHFHWGHACTAISAGLGMASARDLQGEAYEVVAVVGDGAMTGGPVYEALNAGGGRLTKMIVLLNDNTMSIAPNVGGLADSLRRIRSGDEKPAATLFGDLGWAYIGPVDGNDIAAVRAALREARACTGPVIVHALTVKGKGVPYAERHPERYHGCGAFDPVTGDLKPAQGPSYSDVFGQTLVRLAAADRRVAAITAAMPAGTGLSAFAKRFPERFFDVGIAEQHAATFASGLARQGARPVYAVYSSFLQRAYDQVIHDVALQNLPVTLAIDRAGLVEDGATHHGIYDVAFLRCVPNLVMMAPKDENELQHMLYTATQHPGPVSIRYPRSRVRGVAMDSEFKRLAIGKGELVRLGSDAALLGLGTMCGVAEAAAEVLASFGIDVAVINPRFVKPLDAELIGRMAAKTGLLITLEEGVLAGGFGSAVAEALLQSDQPDCWIRHIGIPDTFVPHGAPQIHHAQFGLNVDGVVQAVFAAVTEHRAAWYGHVDARPRRVVYA